jgi:hypothetical protein
MESAWRSRAAAFSWRSGSTPVRAAFQRLQATSTRLPDFSSWKSKSPPSLRVTSYPSPRKLSSRRAENAFQSSSRAASIFFCTDAALGARNWRHATIDPITAKGSEKNAA